MSSEEKKAVQEYYENMRKANPSNFKSPSV